MPNITLGITGFHEILRRDYGIGEPIGDPHWFRRVDGRSIRVGFTFTIYMEKPEIPLGRSNGWRHSVCRFLRSRF